MTDRELIDGLSQGTQAAADFLYEHYWPDILIMLRRKGLSPGDAKDIFQEALLSEFRKRKEQPLELKQATYQTYFTVICNNLYKNHCRRNRRQADVTPEELMLPGEEGAIERALDGIVFQEIIDDALRAVSKLCREILNLCLFTDEPLDKIAITLGITYDATRQRASRCKQRMRKIILDDPRYREMNS